MKCAMDVWVIISLFFLMCACTHVSSQNGEMEAVKNVTSDVAKECRTARNVSGLCLPRQSCDYSTGPIDLTLYAPQGYIRPCASNEVCCPPSAVVNTELNPGTSIEDDNF